MPSADPIISVEDLCKRYVIGHQVRQGLLRDRLTYGARNVFQRMVRRMTAKPANGEQSPSKEDFWALNHVSFEVQRGEVIGIVGRNGAGKSTLLKILSRITEPTSGRIRLRGRVASLLEVGTGFHPELTGRENIFLNGAILGMSRAEIRRKFTEIVDFAEVERFLDTPVKHYSSGMYVRLAFAVAAHLEPEILIVDEVLAVGDTAFQKKCLGKMESVSRGEGRTILFVSHNLDAVRQLCQRAVLLSGGRVQAIDTTSRVLDLYLNGMDPDVLRIPEPGPELRHIGYLTGVSVETPDGRPLSVQHQVGSPWRARVSFKLCRAMKDCVIAIGVVSAEGVAVQTAWSEPTSLNEGDHAVVFQESIILAAGSYTIVASLSEGDRNFQQLRAARLEISGPGINGYYPVTSGVGAVLNSMKISIETRSPLGPPVGRQS